MLSNFYIIIIFLPLLSAIFTLLFGRYFGKFGSMVLTTANMGIVTFLSYYAFFDVALLGNFSYLNLVTWIKSDLFLVNWGFLFDSLSVTMFIVVNTVSFLVHLYSCSYMSEDPHVPRFMSYLSMFTFFMLMLVSADNFIQLFFGWEGVGLCSYLLISFWFTRVSALRAAAKAMVVNRIGDLGLLLGILSIFYYFRSLDFAVVFTLAPYIAGKSATLFGLEFDNILNLVCVLLFVGSIGKSAQLGLHTWLPDAMEGPTPVSALIHAATMVTAGVFLIIRCSPIFEFAPEALVFVTFVGALTAFFAATTGMLQNDIKKVIAYSTCSQLGYMVFACGLSTYSVSFFHLFNHAFFKALLFLSAGAVIHGLSNEQDLRKMGGLAKLMPFTYVMFLIGSLALAGFPFLTGFYSKDVILEVAFAKFSVSSTFAYWLGTVSAFFTAFYSFRLIYLVFFSKVNAYKSYIENAHELPKIMAVPLSILCFGSIFVGYLARDIFIGLGTPFFKNAIFVLPENVIYADSEFLPFYIKNIPVIFTFFGVFLALLLNFYFERDLVNLKLSFKKVYIFLNNKWHFDNLFNFFVTKVMFFGYNISFKIVDKGVLELLGPTGITNLLKIVGFNFRNISRIRSGKIYDFAFIFLFFLFLFLAFAEISFLFNWEVVKNNIFRFWTNA